DDVITRPENEELVLARVQAVLRRARPVGVEVEGRLREPIVLGDLVVDPASHAVSVGGQPMELSAREFLLLYTLAREAGTVIPREDLLKRVWGPHFIGETQTVYVYINWLRNKLRRNAPQSLRIETVHGVGYKLVASESD
ncbi:MAG TPA: response regulator transcription factor, partial [Candidatus Binatia bacterium]|nr:response regulator transcription factor [Candidatus Binatia bacterium]